MPTNPNSNGRALCRRWFAAMRIFLCAVAALALGPSAGSDPLPGRDTTVFSQRALDGASVMGSGGTTTRYWGHDSMSIGYSTVGATGPTAYRGRFMADDFAARASLPIVHVKWWGSYLNNFVSPNFPVNKFLICFESDVPAGPNNPFSHPGQPLLSQIVARGPLSPGSGTFTERPISGGGPPLGETLYEYNAELHLSMSFTQTLNTVYWIKIVALVDLPAGIIIDPNQPPSFVPRWGWHNRDYTTINSLASTAPAVVPGEHIDGFLGPVPGGTPVWHFQDAAVNGSVVVDHLSTPTGSISPVVSQAAFQPTRYLSLADGPSGIENFAMDLAFELYTLGTIPRPDLRLIKAVKPALSNLVAGVQYQLQVSGDSLTWTNHGSPFPATSNYMVYPQYWDVENWNSLFFRAQVAP